MTASPFAEVLDLLLLAPEGNEEAVDAVRMHDAQLTKPPGSLGEMERLVEWLARWQGKSVPTLDNPMVAIFAGNHGVTRHGITPFPPSVTQQMVENFAAGGAAINQICVTHDLGLKIFDLALDYPTGDITCEAALSERDCAATMAVSAEIR